MASLHSAWRAVGMACAKTGYQYGGNDKMKWLKFMFDIIGALKNLFGFGESVADSQRQRDAEKNTADMKAAKVAQQNSAELDQTRKDISNENLEQLQKDIAAPDSDPRA